MRVLIPIITGLVSGVIGGLLGILTRRWLQAMTKPPCRHHWRIMIEKYPTFTQDRWKCEDCGKWQNFRHDHPPIKTDTQICNMGHVHTTAEIPERDEWPNVIS